MKIKTVWNALFFALCLMQFRASAQKILTNRQVYNFDAGDVFEFKIAADPHFNSYVQRRMTVLAVKWSKLNDTVAYTMQKHDYHAVSPGNIYDKTDTINISYTQLDSAVFVPFKLQHKNDTALFSAGFDPKGRPEDNFSYVIRRFEPDSMADQFIAGVGHTILYQWQVGDGGVDSELTYYKKGQQEFGQSFFTGIDVQLPLQTRFCVYPDPLIAGEALYISGFTNAQARLEIDDLQGKTLYNQAIQGSPARADNLNLLPGIYILKLMAPGSTAAQKLVVI